MSVTLDLIHSAARYRGHAWTPAEDEEHARRCARYYRSLGMNPLPSRPSEKRPWLATFSQYRHEAADDAWFEPGGWWSRNIQLVTGAAWNLVVIDCDGDQGVAWWREQCERHDVPATWEVRTASGGLHLWWTPPDIAEVPSGDLFVGVGKHQGVEVKADGCQIVAPPSRYGRKPAYTFEVGPRQLSRPAPLPGWLLDLILELPTRQKQRAKAAYAALPARPTVDPDRLRYRIEEVRDRLDTVAVAQQAGLRLVTTRPNPRGWCVCRSIFREDDRPSASFRPDSGLYSEKGMPAIPFFDLLSRLQPARWPTWQHAVNDHGDRFLGRR